MIRCLEGQFDTWGAFGHGFNNNMSLGGPTPIGARKANLSAEVLPYVEEIALNEQVNSSSLQICGLHRILLAFSCCLHLICYSGTG